ncbi:putative membrane protein [Parabacteroides sp. PFB2-12]|uniref:DUF368 domain-containing protein n=1 Tax=unclassified Parabacteroides TaxID=2649774 RepID=UPI002476AFB6|nr:MULTISPECIES: DUF368 domain-containing protein [unclassified Parabacteroides]MDH6342601.1 putative membrane protein [Parabacteroides sp. PM6-13]MDH6391729.1 putative membrane protein [Parabacteroides sp. PFB2-12]
MKRTIKDYTVLLLKGIGMGAADVVPGVSGGTIAFIVGIYEELIESIKSINGASLKLFFTGKWAAFWKAVNGNFLLALVTGIAISIFSLAKLITWLLETHPILVWSFFFGLVLASTWFVSKDIRKWDWKTIVCFLIGAAIALFITIATPAETPNGLWFIFLSGAIAICAMILPGISGSFILVLLGKYYYIMDAVKSFDIPIMLVFICGAAIGITSFARVLSYTLRRFHDITIAVLAGFMLGSLNKVWPWKETIESMDKHGMVQIAESNILPNEYIWQGFALMVIGFLLVYFLEKLSGKK